MNNAKRTTLSDIPAFILEQAVLGELPAAQQQEIEAMSGFAEYRARLQKDDATILAAYPATTQLTAIREKAARGSAYAWQPKLVKPQTRKTINFVRFSALAVPVAAAALFAILLQPMAIISQNDNVIILANSDPRESNTIKGEINVIPDESTLALATARSQRLARLKAQAGLEPAANIAEALTISVRSAKELLRSVLNEHPQLEIWRQTEGKAEILKPGASVKAFDSLQIAYLAAGRPYGMIVSLDGRGRLTLHYPESFSAVPILDQGNPSVLEFAYQLDDAPKFERFFFITSQTQFKVSAIWTLLEKQLGGANVPAAWAVEAIPNLPAGFDVSSFLLNK